MGEEELDFNFDDENFGSLDDMDLNMDEFNPSDDSDSVGTDLDLDSLDVPEMNLDDLAEPSLAGDQEDDFNAALDMEMGQAEGADAEVEEAGLDLTTEDPAADFNADDLNFDSDDLGIDSGDNDFDPDAMMATSDFNSEAIAEPTETDLPEMDSENDFEAEDAMEGFEDDGGLDMDAMGALEDDGTTDMEGLQDEGELDMDALQGEESFDQDMEEDSLEAETSDAMEDSLNDGMEDSMEDSIDDFDLEEDQADSGLEDDFDMPEDSLATGMEEDSDFEDDMSMSEDEVEMEDSSMETEEMAMDDFSTEEPTEDDSLGLDDRGLDDFSMEMEGLEESSEAMEDTGLEDDFSMDMEEDTSLDMEEDSGLEEEFSEETLEDPLMAEDPFAAAEMDEADFESSIEETAGLEALEEIDESVDGEEEFTGLDADDTFDEDPFAPAETDLLDDGEVDPFLMGSGAEGNDDASLDDAVADTEPEEINLDLDGSADDLGITQAEVIEDQDLLIMEEEDDSTTSVSFDELEEDEDESALMESFEDESAESLEDQDMLAQADFDDSDLDAESLQLQEEQESLSLLMDEDSGVEASEEDLEDSLYEEEEQLAVAEEESMLIAEEDDFDDVTEAEEMEELPLESMGVVASDFSQDGPYEEPDMKEPSHLPATESPFDEPSGIQTGAHEMGKPPEFVPHHDVAMASASENQLGMHILKTINHDLVVEVGRARLKGAEITGITYGSVIELDTPAGDPVDLVLNGKVIAFGEVVQINKDRLGVRVIGINQANE